MPEAIEFVKTNQKLLSRIPVAYFLTCLALYRDAKESRRVARSYMDPVLKTVPKGQAVDMGLFAGALDYSKLRARLKITSHFRIPSSGHLCPILNRKILEIARYYCGFAISDRTNLTQTWVRIL